MSKLSKRFYFYWRVQNSQPALADAALTLLDIGDQPITTGYTLNNWAGGAGAYTAPDANSHQDEYSRCAWTFAEAVEVGSIAVVWPDANNIPTHMAGYDEDWFNPDFQTWQTRIMNFDTGSVLEAGGYVIPPGPEFSVEAMRDSENPRIVHITWTYGGATVAGFALVNDASMTTLATTDAVQRSYELEYSRFSALSLRLYTQIDANGNWGEFVSAAIPNAPPAVIPTPTDFTVIRTLTDANTATYHATWAPVALADEVDGYDEFDYVLNATRSSDGFIYGESTDKTASLDIVNALNPADEWTFTVKTSILNQQGDYFESDWSSAIIIPPALQDVASIAIRLLEEDRLFHIDWTYVYPNTEGQNTQIPLEIEISVDSSEYKSVTLATDTSVYPTFTIDSTLLYVLYWDSYSDGAEHAVQVRCKTPNTLAVTGHEWIVSPVLYSIVPSSPHQPAIEWVYHQIDVYGKNEAIPVGAPRIRWQLPEVSAYSIQVDLNNPVLIGNWSQNALDVVLTDWIAYVPVSSKDGVQHSIRFIFDVTQTPPVMVVIPERSAIMPAAPSNFVLTFKKLRDAFTNVQTGCEFTARLTYENSATVQLKAQASVDYGAFVDITWTALTAYPPTIKLNGVVIPQDGLSHVVQFKLWHLDTQTSESSTELLTSSTLAVFDLAPPPPPTNITATLIRPGDVNVTDQVRVTWESEYPVTVIVVDPDNKKRTLYTALDSESEAVVENTRRFGPDDGVAHNYRFGVAAFNRSNSSEAIYAVPFAIVSNPAATVAQTPDDIAGTAVTMSQPQLITALSQETAIDSAIMQNAVIAIVQKIKDVVAKGGSVTLDNLGKFTASWTEEKTSYRNGQYVTVPAQRNGIFVESIGFIKGTRAGLVLSDTEAMGL